MCTPGCPPRGSKGRLLLSFPSTVLIQDAAAGLHGQNLRQKQSDKYPLVNKRRNEHSHLEMYKWETLGSVIEGTACVKLTFNLSHDPCVKMLSWKLQRSVTVTLPDPGPWEKPGTVRPMFCCGQTLFPPVLCALCLCTWWKELSRWTLRFSEATSRQTTHNVMYIMSKIILNCTQACKLRNMAPKQPFKGGSGRT